MTNLTRNISNISLIVLAAAFMLPLIGCPNTQVPGSDQKVAKVNTAYIYEANINQHVQEWRASLRTNLSNFIGASPNEILHIREMAIISEIRKEVKRLPGVEISTREKAELADSQVEDEAWEIYAQLIEGSSTFAETAIRYSDAPSARSGGQLQPFRTNEHAEEYQTFAYTMEPGEISEPFSSWDGWRIIRLDEVDVDELNGTSYTISLILLTPDPNRAEATLIDRKAEEETIEVLDPKYLARRYYIAGNYEDALESADSAIARDSTDDLAHYLRASVLWELGRTDEALEAMAQAVEHGTVADAFTPYFHYFMGYYLEKLDRPNEARDEYRAAYDDGWQQDYTIALALEETYERLGDTEYLEIIQTEIETIRTQDRTAWLYSSPDLTKPIIVTGEGQISGSSAVYEPGWLGSGK